MRRSHAARNVAAVLAVSLALPGCAATGSPVRGCPRESVALDPVARVPARIYGGVPFIDATMNGAPLRLVLDTGAGRTLLSEAAVERAGLRRDPRRASRIMGVGGSSSGRDAVADAIVIGGATLPLSGVMVGPFTLGTAETQVDGLLGADIWRRFDVDLDLPARTATLYRAQPCPRSAPPWPGPAIEIDGVGGPPDRLVLPVALDGIAAVAVFDTGAQVSGVSPRVAALAPAAEGPARMVRIRGAGAGVARLPARRFASLRIGPLLFADPVLPILPLPAGFDALVGEDMLRGCRAWFSFAARQVFLSAPGAELGPNRQITLACPRSSP